MSSEEYEELNDSYVIDVGSSSKDERDEHLAVIEIGVLGVIFCAAIVGNSFMLVALWRQIHFCPRSRMYLFMLHLSIADLLVAIFSVLPQMIWKITFRFKGGELTCRAVKYMQVMVLYLSTYILVMMAVDRYRAICWTSRWHQWNSLKVAKCLVAIAWFLSLVFAIPQALLFSIVEWPSTSSSIVTVVRDCWVVFEEPWSAKIYVTWFVTSAFVVPLVALTYCYGVITFRIWTYDPDDGRRQPSNVANGLTTNKGGRTNQMSYAKLKTIKLTFIVVMCFFVCWSPFCVTQLIMAYNPSDKAGPVETIFALLACLNSCTNPWIYLAFSGSLLNHLRVCLRIGTRRSRDNGSIGDDEPEHPVVRQNHRITVNARALQRLQGAHEHENEDRGRGPVQQQINCAKLASTKSEIA